MAYVSISQDLRNAVRSNIDTMRRMERDGIKMPEAIQDKTASGLDPTMEQLVWGVHYPLKAVMPKEWLRETESVNLRTKITFEDGSSQKVGVRVTFSPRMTTPPNADRYGYDIDLPADHPSVPDLIAYHTEMRYIDKRWKEVGTQIMEFLGACKSLNEALKLWPDVRIYIPKEFLERAERKVERTTNSGGVEAIKKVDTDAAVSAAAIARMMGAIGSR
jgi:hypothetical protein